MKLKEITELIQIRNYVSETVASLSSIDKATVKELHGILILLDNKIIEMLKDEKFKSYIKYENVKNAIEHVVKLNNFKAGLFNQ